MAAKRAPDLIPLCHSLMISKVSLRFEIDRPQNAIKSIASVETQGQTGVEIEALTAVQIALLTIYDMCKAVDRGMLITDVRLEENPAASRVIGNERNSNKICLRQPQNSRRRLTF